MEKTTHTQAQTREMERIMKEHPNGWLNYGIRPTMKRSKYLRLLNTVPSSSFATSKDDWMPAVLNRWKIVASRAHVDVRRVHETFGWHAAVQWKFNGVEDKVQSCLRTGSNSKARRNLSLRRGARQEHRRGLLHLSADFHQLVWTYYTYIACLVLQPGPHEEVWRASSC